MSLPLPLPGAAATKLIFDQAKNFMTCAGLFAAGAITVRHGGPAHDWLPAGLAQGAGWGVAGLGVGLALLNLVDGVRHLAGLRYRRLLVVSFVVAYLVASARVLTLVTSLRLGGGH